MKIKNNQNQIFLEKFGAITTNTILVVEGKTKSTIEIERIDKVNLIKNRVFYTNMIMLAIAIMLFTKLVNAQNLSFYPRLMLTLISVLLAVYGLIHKFYFYKLTIKLKNNQLVEVRTTQLNRKSIKSFYSEIVQTIKSAKNLGLIKAI